ncbi:hypothetical protein HNP82_003169 [Catenibacillus scindens]|uniref:Pit accessory protein n=1 Tax=Catenibacillus scindens TaxID=673271 RepID=A0A7W8M6W5_9FIRM|nr:DUF47 family protein [Catenibacillus scindens]MBB5266017.1 hypothetical protein [Catenibacillus scindens]
MSKKQDAFYFDNFTACAEDACRAAHMLRNVLSGYRLEDVSQWLDKIHQIEHEADDKKHQLTDRVSKAFITPIDREDIVALSHSIDEVTDKIEEVFIRIYINNVPSIRSEAIALLDIVIQCCEEVCKLLQEFSDFKHSRNLKESIIRINTLEEEADKMFISSMRALHSEEKDTLHIIAWREIYDYLEKCADACEHVADGVETVIMKNS